MSRKSRSTEVLEKLGEPLPLLYINETSKLRLEENVNEPLSSSANQLADHIKRRKVRISSGEGWTDPPTAKEPSVSLRRLRQYEVEVEQETILDEIERKISLLKQANIHKSLNGFSPDYAILLNINRELDDISSRQLNDSILNELERLQGQSPQLSEKKLLLNHGGFLLVVSVVLGLSILSFFAGHFSYEYCYYFC